jgi:hypothetical protein
MLRHQGGELGSGAEVQLREHVRHMGLHRPARNLSHLADVSTLLSLQAEKHLIGTSRYRTTHGQRHPRVAQRAAHD